MSYNLYYKISNIARVDLLTKLKIQTNSMNELHIKIFTVKTYKDIR